MLSAPESELTRGAMGLEAEEQKKTLNLSRQNQNVSQASRLGDGIRRVVCFLPVGVSWSVLKPRIEGGQKQEQTATGLAFPSGSR